MERKSLAEFAGQVAISTVNLTRQSLGRGPRCARESKVEAATADDKEANWRDH